MSTEAKITFALFDVTAKADSTPACAAVQPFTDLMQLKQVPPPVPPYATLEQDLFLLDGNVLPFPDTPAGSFWGLWSQEQSGADGTFIVPPVLTIAFDRDHSSMALTLVFYPPSGDYCSLLEVKWYNHANQIIMQRPFRPTGVVAVLDCKVENYRRIEITFQQTAKSYRYLKLTRIDYGVELCLDGKKISGASILEEVDVTSAQISMNTLNFTLHDSGDFSPLNPQGIFSVLQQRQKLDAVAVVDGMVLPMGEFYLSGWESDGKSSIRMTATDPIGLLDTIRFDGGIYTNVAAGTLLAQITTEVGVEHTIEPSLASQTISGYLPICTHRQALQQLVLAIGGVVDCSRSGKIQISQLPQRPSALIGYERKFDSQTLKLKPLVTGVDVVAHRYLATQQSQELFNDTLPAGSYRIEFGLPAHSITATGATITGGNANHADITVALEGAVVLSGHEYQDSRQTVSRRLVNAPANALPNILKIENATLISRQLADGVATRVLDYYQLRYQNEFTLRLGAEKVADMLVVRSLNGENLRGLVESLEIDLTGGCLAKVRLAGVRIETLAQSHAGEFRAGDTMGVM